MVGVLGAIKMVGGLAAGSGACLVTEYTVMALGREITGSKAMRICVDLAAWALGAVAFDQTYKAFGDQVDMTVDSVKSLKDIWADYRKAHEEIQEKEVANAGEGK